MTANMNKTGKYILIGATLAGLAVSSVLSADGQALLKSEHGARPAGMATAVTSLRIGPDGAAYNPASIAGTDNFSVSFGHVAYWENVRLESGYFSSNLSGRTSFYGGIRFAAVDEIEGRPNMPTDEPWQFESYDFSIKLGLASWSSSRFGMGIAIGSVFEKIGGHRGGALSSDLGAIFLYNEKVSLGASILNIGPDLILSQAGRVDSRPIRQPTTYRAGLSYLHDKHLAAVDFVYLDNAAHVHLGAESKLHSALQLRAGYMLNYSTKNLTAGASFVRDNLAVHYAFVPYSRSLGTSHMFNLAFGL